MVTSILVNAKIERLFRILKILSSRKLTRAKDLARQFGVSERTIYRDIATLVGSGVPIEGEAGVGYLLRGDPELVRLLAGLPATFPTEEAVEVPAASHATPSTVSPTPRPGAPPQSLARLLTLLKLSISQRRRIRFYYYTPSNGKSTARTTARPLCLLFGGQEWILGAWCETSSRFEDYHVERLSGLELLSPMGSLEGPTWQEYLLRRPDLGGGTPLAPSAPAFDD